SEQEERRWLRDGRDPSRGGPDVVEPIVAVRSAGPECLERHLMQPQRVAKGPELLIDAFEHLCAAATRHGGANEVTRSPVPDVNGPGCRAHREIREGTRVEDGQPFAEAVAPVGEAGTDEHLS